MSWRVIIAVSLLFAARGARAQAAYRLTLAPGTDVRFIVRGASSTAGRAEGIAGDTLLLAGAGGGRSRRVLLSDLASLQVRGGRDRRRGTIIGTAVLGVITAVAGGIDYSHGNISGGDLMGTTVGNAVLGGLLGYALAPTGWVGLPLPSP